MFHPAAWRRMERGKKANITQCWRGASHGSIYHSQYRVEVCAICFVRRSDAIHDRHETWRGLTSFISSDNICRHPAAKAKRTTKPKWRAMEVTRRFAIFTGKISIIMDSDRTQTAIKNQQSATFHLHPPQTVLASPCLPIDIFSKSSSSSLSLRTKQKKTENDSLDGKQRLPSSNLNTKDTSVGDPMRCTWVIVWVSSERGWKRNN